MYSLYLTLKCYKILSQLFIFGRGFRCSYYKLCFQCFLLLFQIIKEFLAKICRVLILCVLIMTEHRMDFKGERESCLIKFHNDENSSYTIQRKCFSLVISDSSIIGESSSVSTFQKTGAGDQPTITSRQR